MAALGLAVVVLGYLGYLAMLFVFRRFTYRTWLFDAVILAGIAFGLLALVIGDAWLPAVIAIGLGVLWFPVTRHELTIVGSPRLTVAAGDALPRFAARRPDGTPMTDQDVVARAPALLVLYRGWWCPSTRALFDELHGDLDQLTAAGLTLFAASVDTPELAAGIQDSVGDEINILADFPVPVLEQIGARDRRGAPWYDRLIFRAPAGDIAMPTALVIGATGRITYAFRASRVDERARPADILGSLEP